MPVEPEAAHPIERLSRRQRECLRLVPMTSKEIAAELGLEWRTVDSYLSDALKRLGISDRRQAARMLREYEEAIPQRFGYEPPELVPTQDPSNMGSSPAPAETPEAATAWTVREARTQFDVSPPPPQPTLRWLVSYWTENFSGKVDAAQRSRAIVKMTLLLGVALFIVIAVGETLQRTLRGLGY
jgi:DNA-binding CsgD family transcriptional regulator